MPKDEDLMFYVDELPATWNQITFTPWTPIFHIVNPVEFNEPDFDIKEFYEGLGCDTYKQYMEGNFPKLPTCWRKYCKQKSDNKKLCKRECEHYKNCRFLSFKKKKENKLYGKSLI